MIRVICMALMNDDPGGRHDLRRRLRGAGRPTASASTRTSTSGSRCSGNILAVRRDPLRRQPVGQDRPPARRSSSARSASGLLSFGYLYAISIHSVPLAIVMSLLMWGVVYQGYNAVFPSFYPELFPTRTRVSAMAISPEHRHARITALLPALFAAVRPSGHRQHPDDRRRDRLRDHGDRGGRRLDVRARPTAST